MRITLYISLLLVLLIASCKPTPIIEGTWMLVDVNSSEKFPGTMGSFDNFISITEDSMFVWRLDPESNLLAAEIKGIRRKKDSDPFEELQLSLEKLTIDSLILSSGVRELKYLKLKRSNSNFSKIIGHTYQTKRKRGTGVQQEFLNDSTILISDIFESGEPFSPRLNKIRFDSFAGHGLILHKYDAVIFECDENAELITYSGPFGTIDFRQIEPKKPLILEGDWTYDSERNKPLPPPPPDAGLANPIMTLSIDADSLLLNYNGKLIKQKYQSTNSGNLFYLSNQSLWKIVLCTDSMLAIEGSDFSFPRHPEVTNDTLYFTSN